MLRKLLNLFRKEQSIFEEPTTFSDDSEDEVLSMLDNYDKNKSDIQKWHSDGFLERRELDKQLSNYQIMFCLIPKLQNYRNVRSYIEYQFGDWKKWQELRELLFYQHNNICQFCKKHFDDSNLELHEYWTFNDFEKEQKLHSLIPLCKECHGIAHITRFMLDRNKTNELLNKYSKYNKLSIDKAKDDIDFHYQINKRRENTKYQLNLYLLNNYGFYVDELFDCHTPKFDSLIHRNFSDNQESEE